MLRQIVVVLFFVMLTGCAVIDGGVEVSKTLWGSSTRALEEGRATAITKTYNKSFWDVVRAAETYCQRRYIIFKKEEVKGYMVLVGVKGAVNTTEVGVFFVEPADQQTRIEVTSLSTNAKRIVSKELFHGLDVSFGLVPPDAVEYGMVSKIDFLDADPKAQAILDELLKVNFLEIDVDNNLRLSQREGQLINRPEILRSSSFDAIWDTLQHQNN